jgi:hypothetical protein
MGSVEKAHPRVGHPGVVGVFDHSFNASTLMVLPLAAGLTHPLS